MYSLAAGDVCTIKGAWCFCAAENKAVTCSGFEILIAGIQKFP